MDVSLRFKSLAEQWFLTEPAFFAIFCTHELAINPHMSIPIRTGKGRIEYNPELIEPISDCSFEELVGIEMLRLFLKHPYERTPEDVSRSTMKIASDLTLTSHYRFSYHSLVTPKDLNLPSCKHYEWYLNNLPKLGGNNEGEGCFASDIETRENENSGVIEADAAGVETQGEGNSGATGAQAAQNPSLDNPLSQSPEDMELTELWEEDESRQVEINELVETVKDWGTIPGSMSATIIANTKAKIDYRKALSGFRASVISSARSLTRMKPNRRTGFAHMGSKHDFSTRLLIAVDVSGSVSNTMLRHFYSVITKFFKYGIKEIDVVQFDTDIKGGVLSLEYAKKQKEFNISGRGGTCFQPIFDYIECHRQYDGLIILTDGYAPVPTRKRKTNTRVLWVCESEESYNLHHKWMKQFGRVCFMNLK